MANPLDDDMIEATRLTQAGKLTEATALLQRLFRSRAAASAHSSPAQRPTLELHANPASPEPAPKLAEILHGVADRFQLTKQALQALAKSPPPSKVVPNVGQFVARTFSNEAGKRAYKLYIPSAYDDKPRPLIVMLHGCSQSPDDFAAGTRMNFAAEEHTCFVVYPEQSSSANSARCWNWYNASNQRRGYGEASIIAGITRAVMSEYKIDPRRVYVAGLSAGGAAAAIVAEAYPDLYAAAGVHSGLACGVARDLPSAFAAMQGNHPVPDPASGRDVGESIHVPTIVFHGDRDSTVHPRNSAEVIARARAGVEFKTVTERGSVDAGHSYSRSMLRDVSGRRMLEEWVIHGAGHAWSGGSSAGSFTDPKGPDATKEMLRFFLAHTLDPKSRRK